MLGLGFYHREIIQSIEQKNIVVIQQGIKAQYFLHISSDFINNINHKYWLFFREKWHTIARIINFSVRVLEQLQTYPILKSLPIPIPVAYLQALDFGKYKQETGFGSGMPYLLGQLGFIVNPVQGFKIKGFPQYFLITFLYKVPDSYQIFILVGIYQFISLEKTS
jgi:hypothetical protein